MKLLKVTQCFIFLLILSSCTNKKSMDYIITYEQNITGIVLEASDEELLVQLQDDNGESSLCYVSLDVQNQDSMTYFNEGDEIVVYYDGEIQKTSLMQINTVYAITLLTPTNRSEISEINKLDAEELALKDAGLERNDIKYINSYEEYRDYSPYSYEIEFGLKGDIEYHYSILIETGEIIEKRVEQH